jgi:anti-sigma factor (TIGR02949 family)
MNALNRYTCEEAFRRLDDFLDRELSPDEMELVQQHLAICEGCAREFSFEASILANVRDKLRQVELPPGLAALVQQVAARAAGDSGAGEAGGKGSPTGNSC